jgi:predicted signal transduction protein with EAL and GGDEF domain
LLARLGGDEFALLLPESGAEGASAILTRLQELLCAEMPVRGWPVTVSVGAITFLRPPRNVDLMIQCVDALMYKAKRNGKGRVEHEVAESIPDRLSIVGKAADDRAGEAHNLLSCTVGPLPRLYRSQPDGASNAGTVETGSI